MRAPTAISVEPVVQASEAEHRKRLGAFYTPAHLAQALADWAIRSDSDRVLDPAAGEAVFLAAAARKLLTLGSRNPSPHLVGIEIDSDALAKAGSLLSQEGCTPHLELNDFFSVTPPAPGEGFDAVIGNPPYVRYHRFRGPARQRGIAAAAASGVRLSRLTSSWAPFVVHAARFLRPGGRLALVLPAELLHVDYAGPIREFLLRRFASVTVVTFEQAVFPGASIDAVLLLAQDGPHVEGLRIVSLSDAGQVRQSLTGLFSAAPVARWSRLRAPAAGVDALEQLRRDGKILALSGVASVDIGCVTGANDFFILTREEARNVRVRPHALQPVIARPRQLSGAILRKTDIRAFGDDERHLMLRLRTQNLDKQLSPLSRYLRHGQHLGIDERYKCRVRHPWYAIPGIRVPDAFLSYMSHRTPRLVLNRAGLSSTNLVHQITFNRTSRKRAPEYIAAMYSSVTLLSFELEGRSYGGGVLKLETREAERVDLPRFDGALGSALRVALNHIDEAVRRGHPELATRIVDDLLLAHSILDAPALEAVRTARAELEERRSLRGRTIA